MVRDPVNGGNRHRRLRQTLRAGRAKQTYLHMRVRKTPYSRIQTSGIYTLSFSPRNSAGDSGLRLRIAQRPADASTYPGPHPIVE